VAAYRPEIIMNNKKICTSWGVVFAVGPCLATAQAADFFADSKVDLEMRNFYMNRDFRDGSGPSKRDEWAQGFILRAQSGYTPGVVGFGLDAIAMVGLKLDSSPDRTGTGLLPVRDDGSAPGEYSKAGLTAKMRVSKTELKVGTLMPKLPTLQANFGRLLPQTFRGGMIESREWNGLELIGGHLDQVTDRDVTGARGLSINNKNRRFSGALDGGNFELAGAAYRWKHFQLTYQLGRLEDVYQQHYLGFNSTHDVGEGKFKADLRLFVSDDQGKRAPGRWTIVRSAGWLPMNGGATHSAWGIKPCTGIRRFPTSTVPTLTWSTSCRWATLPRRANAHGKCVMRATWRRGACRG